MNITKITKNGREIYRVYLGMDSKKKKRYKQFLTCAKATKWVSGFEKRIENQGKKAASVDGGSVTSWHALDQELMACNTSLLKVGEEALKRLQAVRKEGTALMCLDAFVAAKIKQGKRPAYISDIKSRCLRFLAEHPENLPAKSIVAEMVTTHLDNLPGELSQNRNQRRNLGVWLRWAAANEWVGKATMPPTPIGEAGQNTQGEVVILTPADAAKILRLAITSESWDVLAYLVISLFAGVRPGEFRKTVYEKRKRVTATLNWEDITQHGIAISGKLAKTGSPRLIPLTYPLIPWIELITGVSGKKTGPIRPIKWREIWDGWRAKHWLDDMGSPIPWHMDQLRHTFGSYRVAITKHLDNVAIEMGNSARVVYRHYWRWSTKESEAKDFWALDPPNAYGDVLKYESLKKAEKEITEGFFSKY